MGKSAGLTLRKKGREGMEGSRGSAAAIAVCTSWAAESMLRLRLNCKVTLVELMELLEFMLSIPEIVANWRSRTVATVVAMVSGLAPGSEAETDMVGKSTLGSALMGS